MLFDFLNDLYNYEDRQIDIFEKDNLIVDTCRVSDGKQPYETCISHPDYHSGKFIIVEVYDDADDAKEGHDKWVNIMIQDMLPDKLIDCCNTELGEFYKNISGEVVYQKENK